MVTVGGEEGSTKIYPREWRSPWPSRSDLTGLALFGAGGLLFLIGLVSTLDWVAFGGQGWADALGPLVIGFVLGLWGITGVTSVAHLVIEESPGEFLIVARRSNLRIGAGELNAIRQSDPGLLLDQPLCMTAKSGTIKLASGFVGASEMLGEFVKHNPWASVTRIESMG